MIIIFNLYPILADLPFPPKNILTTLLFKYLRDLKKVMNK